MLLYMNGSKGRILKMGSGGEGEGEVENKEENEVEIKIENEVFFYVMPISDEYQP